MKEKIILAVAAFSIGVGLTTLYFSREDPCVKRDRIVREYEKNPFRDIAKDTYEKFSGMDERTRRAYDAAYYACNRSFM